MTTAAEESLERLKEGNRKFLLAPVNTGDISPALRQALLAGQHPYAVILTCSDSRVVPESIFSADLGDLFVIRVAGNVVGDHTLGSIEYASAHLGTPLTVVLGHTNCGAVDAAIHDAPHGFIKTLTDKIRAAIGSETDGYRASCLNVENSVRKIQAALPGVDVIGAVYRLEDGSVEFL
ncbi:MAG: carbonic anhydrase [Clostridia bacterium]|nr:carbonic anhydrase [Clostridia bacterium]